MVGGPHCEVNAVLWSHHPEVRHQVVAAMPTRRHRGALQQLLRVWSRANDSDVGGTLAAASHRHLAVGLVGRDHVLRGLEGAPLEQTQSPVKRVSSSAE